MVVTRMSPFAILRKGFKHLDLEQDLHFRFSTGQHNFRRVRTYTLFREIYHEALQIGVSVPSLMISCLEHAGCQQKLVTRNQNLAVYK